jgi:hypothetical protein
MAWNLYIGTVITKTSEVRDDNKAYLHWEGPEISAFAGAEIRFDNIA